MNTYRINGRNYRKTPYQLKFLAENSGNFSSQKLEKFEDTPDIYEDEPAAGCLAPPGLPALRAKKDKKEDNSNSDPQPTEDGRIQVIGGKKWISEISVPLQFLGKLIGTNRRALNALENETQCRVKTHRKDENRPCEITSIISLECVQRCLDRIEIFLDDARKSARPTHFVAFPCDFDEVKENFEIFKQMVTESEHFDISCKNPNLFTKTARLHLTIGVAKLFEKSEIQNVEKMFAELEEEIREMLGSRPLIADIQGVDIMNDDPAQTTVLYAKVGGDDVQHVANHVARRLFHVEDHVKLHMTLMNARYVAQAENSRKSTSFDARKVLEDLGESYFGTVPIREICLCPLNSSAPADKFYEKVAVLKI